MTPQDLCRKARQWLAIRKTPVPRDHLEKAVAKHYDPHYWGSSYEMKQRDRAIWAKTPIEMKQLAQDMAKQARLLHFPFYVHTNWRSPELQMKLYLQGNSTLQSGAHQRSAAIDCVHPHEHWHADQSYWEALGMLAKTCAAKRKIAINWGGDWESFPDPAHIELKKWKELPIVDIEPEDEDFLQWSIFQKLEK